MKIGSSDRRCIPAPRPPAKDLDDAGGGMPIPERRGTRWSVLIADPMPPGSDPSRIGSNQAIRSVRDRYRTLGVFAHRQTGNTQDGCFFLDAAGVGDHDAAIAHEPEKIQVPQWRKELEASIANQRGRHSGTCDDRPCARMD